MNPAFILVVAFGVLVVLVVVGTSIFNVMAARSSPSAPWMSRVRRFQEESANAGWRIHLIPYGDTSRPMTFDAAGVVSIVPLIGAFAFLVGIAIATYNEKYVARGLMVGVPGLGLAFAGYWLKQRVVRRDWDVAPARCIDRELKQGPTAAGRPAWFWRIICEYEYLGIPYRVTPGVYWAGFNSEEAARKFLEERISADGQCTLRVDPKNPLRTELFDQSIKNPY